jgi:hypothetical protein
MGFGTSPTVLRREPLAYDTFLAGRFEFAAKVEQNS